MPSPSTEISDLPEFRASKKCCYLLLTRFFVFPGVPQYHANYYAAFIIWPGCWRQRSESK